MTSERAKVRHARTWRKLRIEAPLKLWSSKDIAFNFEIPIRTVRGWRERYADFPKPAAVVSGYMPIFFADEVKEWVGKMTVEHRQFGVTKPRTVE